MNQSGSFSFMASSGGCLKGNRSRCGTPFNRRRESSRESCTSSARDRKTERIVYPPFRRIWMKTKEVRLGKQSAVPNNLVFNTAFARVLHAHAKMPVTLVAGKPTIESIEGVRTCKIRPKSAIKSPPLCCKCKWLGPLLE